MGKRRLSREELILWRAVAAQARPLPGRTLPETPPDAVAPPAATPEPAPPARRPAKARATPPAPPPPKAAEELAHGRTAGVDRRQAERLSRGR
jgi:DNA-nicking Smr family endonuclease